MVDHPCAPARWSARHNRYSMRSVVQTRTTLFSSGGCLLHDRLVNVRSVVQTRTTSFNPRRVPPARPPCRPPFCCSRCLPNRQPSCASLTSVLPAVRTIERQVCLFVRPAGRTVTRTNYRDVPSFKLSADTTVRPSDLRPPCKTAEPLLILPNDLRPPSISA